MQFQTGDLAYYSDYALVLLKCFDDPYEALEKENSLPEDKKHFVQYDIDCRLILQNQPQYH